MGKTTVKKHYIVPVLTIVSFRTECGYAMSVLGGPGPFDEVLFFEERHDTRQVEIYDKTPYWDNEGNHFWE